MPKVYVNGSTVSLKAVVTITTDLGETFYPHNVNLAASVRSAEHDGDIYLRRTIQWEAGMRSVPISFDLTRSGVEWPACLHVGIKQGERSEHFENWDKLKMVSVWSAEINPTKGLFQASRRVERRFIPISERPLVMLEDAGDSIARHLWDGSVALTAYIDRTVSLQSSISLPLLEYVLVSATYRRLNVLELGCGCGIVGIALAQTIPDCDVLLTDLPEVTELVNDNIERMNPAIASKVSFEPLDWEKELPAKMKNRTNDLVIVSECTYNTDTLQPLVSSLSAIIARSPKAVILVATKTRHDSEAAFFDMMKSAGFVGDSNTKVPLPGDPGQGYADWATDVGLHVYHGQDHRLSLSPRQRSEESVDKVRTRSRRNSPASLKK